MKRDCLLIISLITIAVSLLTCGSLYAWSDQVTHPQITKIAAEEKSELEDYLKNNLGFEEGLKKEFTTGNIKKDVLKWLQYGAEVEWE